MKKRVALLIVFAISMIVSALWYLFPRPISAAKTAVSARMKDPSSVQFKDVELLSGGTVCGLFNARNSFGAYGGFKLFGYSSKGELYIEPVGSAPMPRGILSSSDGSRMSVDELEKWQEAFLIYEREVKEYMNAVDGIKRLCVSYNH